MRVWFPVLGCIAGCAAQLWFRDTPAGTMLWAIAVLASARGYGSIIDRVTGRAVSDAITIVTGVAALLLISTACARIGILGRSVEYLLLVAGVLGSALVVPPSSSVGGSAAVGYWVFGAIAALWLMLTATLDVATPIADGANHVFVVKALWDTGSLATVHHQIGIQLVGESYVALAGGASSVGTFEAGFCTALIIYVLADELARGSHALRRLLFAIAVLAIVLHQQDATPEAQWSGALFLLTAFISLRSAFETSGRPWHVIVIALALAGVRHEYALLAAPYLIAGFALPTLPSRRGLWLLGYFAFAVVLQIGLAVPPMRALANAACLVVVAALVRVVLAAMDLPWRTALGVALFAALSFGLALWLDAIRPAQHSDSATLAVWFSFLLVGAMTSEERTWPPLLATAALTFVWVLSPLFEIQRRDAALGRFRTTTYALKRDLMLGHELSAHETLARLQAIAPPGKPIGFWGQNAALLDHARNRIRDISWPSGTKSRRNEAYLSPLTRANLAKVDYVLVESVFANRAVDTWDTRRTAVPNDVASLLESVGTLGDAALYRVRR